MSVIWGTGRGDADGSKSGGLPHLHGVAGVAAVLSIIEKTGLRPTFMEDKNWATLMYWETGPNEHDRYFFIEFKDTPEFKDFGGDHGPIVIPFDDGVWLHFDWF